MKTCSQEAGRCSLVPEQARAASIQDAAVPDLQKVDAVVPLTLKDYDRFEILRKSCNRFLGGLGTCWVVTPDREAGTLSDLIHDERFRVVPETDVVPEFSLFRSIPGWYKQQLIKMAIATAIETPFYLTLDADVICVRQTDTADLVKQNRAACHLIPGSLSRGKARWYEWAEATLNLEVKRRQLHNVTPAVLSREAMLRLQEYLTTLYAHGDLSPGHRGRKRTLLLSLLRRGGRVVPAGTSAHEWLCGWRTYLALSLPWTEYALYYSFLEGTDLFHQYHFETDCCLYSVERSIWYEDQLSSWNPSRIFDPGNPYCFVVFQSTLPVSAERLWDSVRTFIE
jgi:hypothetical protein